MVVAARCSTELPEVNDSKVLSKKRREQAYEKLLAVCEFGEGWVEPSEIDSLGLTESMKLAVSRSLSSLEVNENAKIIMDGHINYCDDRYVNVECVIKADGKIPIVSAASIIAKQLRDAKMVELAEKYKNYGFENHVGYGTKQHIEALKKHGICEIHRKSYKPVYTLANL